MKHIVKVSQKLHENNFIFSSITLSFENPLSYNTILIWNDQTSPRKMFGFGNFISPPTAYALEQRTIK